MNDKRARRTPPEFRARRLAVVGLGLMGGSLALAMRDHADQIIGYDRDETTREHALQKGIVDEVGGSARETVKAADVVVLAAPAREILAMLTRPPIDNPFKEPNARDNATGKSEYIGDALQPAALLIDLGSTKELIVEAMGNLPVFVEAVGGHPMTGKEYSGIMHADAKLYTGCSFALCLSKRTTWRARERAESFVEALCATVEWVDAKRHDDAVAAVSHLPYILSAMLFKTASSSFEETTPASSGNSDHQYSAGGLMYEKISGIKEFLKDYRLLAAGGFRSTSRIAASDGAMMTDIAFTNTDAIRRCLARFSKELTSIEVNLADGDDKALLKAFQDIQSARAEWVEKYEN